MLVDGVGTSGGENVRPMNDEIPALQARLRQIDDHERKGLMRAAEAAAARAAAQRALARRLVPEVPAPRPSWRARAAALAAMAALVGGVSAYLLSGPAGLRRQSREMLAAAAAQDAAWRRERLERERAGLPVGPDRAGRFPQTASAATAVAAPVAPLLSGRIVLDAALAGRVAPDDALFVTVRRPDDPTGLPLAQFRVDAADLPLAYRIGARETLGSPERLMRATRVVVTARLSKSGSGQSRPGDLFGRSPPVAPWSTRADVAITQAVPAP
jgi:cytochrome c-type biogenesis protein CcmH